jgi:hypothetical protein
MDHGATRASGRGTDGNRRGGGYFAHHGRSGGERRAHAAAGDDLEDRRGAQLGWKERDSVTGAWKQKTTTFRGTKKRADAELAKIINAINTGGYVEPSKTTVREFLERWLRDYVAIHVPKRGTRGEYETIVKRHMIPTLGAIPLAKLSAPKVQECYREKLAGGRLKGTGERARPPGNLSRKRPCAITTWRCTRRSTARCDGG